MQKLDKHFKWKFPLFLLLLWASFAFLINPLGNFPINDDWIYAKPIESALNGNGFQVSNQATVTSILHSLMGYALCSVTGFSFSVLRLLVLIEAAGLLLLLFKIFSRLGLRKKSSTLFCLLFLTNPLFIGLSYSFMTDIPFLFFSIASLERFLAYLQTGKRMNILYGTLLSILATGVRQPGALLPLAVFIVVMFHREKRNQDGLLLFLATSLPFLMLAAYPWFMNSVFNLSAWYNAQSLHLFHILIELDNTRVILQNLIFNGALCIFYLGIFLLPLLLILSYHLINHPDLLTSKKKFGALLFGLSLILFTLLAKIFGGQMPFTGNMITKSGMGPVMLRDIYILGIPNNTQLSSFYWKCATFLSILGAAFIPACMYGVTGLAYRRQLPGYTPIWQLLYTLGGLYMIPMLILGIFDRYMILALPICLCLLALFWKEQAGHAPQKFYTATRIASWIIGTGIAFYGVMGTHDFMEMQRSRWKLLHDLVTIEHVSPEKIDGGFEFNGWYTYSYPKKEVTGKSWWWVIDDSYILTLGPVPGYSIKKTQNFEKWFPPKQSACYLLKKLPAPAS